MWTTRSVVVGLACLGAACAIGGYLHRYGLTALAVDRAAVRSWLGGDDLYAYRSTDSRMGTAEPPAAAMLLVVLAVLPLVVAGWLLALAGVAALLGGLTVPAGTVARRYGRPRWPVVLLVGGLAVATEPVRATLGYGRLDLVIFGLVMADVVALRRAASARVRVTGWPRRTDPDTPGGPTSRDAPQPANLLRRCWAAGTWAGVGTGVATALAVSPALFLGYLVLTRQWRAALTGLGTAASLVGAGLLIAPATTASWWGTVFLQADRSGPVDTASNQSLAGMLTRLYDTQSIPVLVWPAFAVLLVAVGLIRARSAHADGDEAAAFTLVGLTIAAVAPVTHIHGLVWMLPAVVMLVETAIRRRQTSRPPRAGRFTGAGYGAAAVLMYLLLVVDPQWTVGWDAYALAVILLLNALPWVPAGASVAIIRPMRRVAAIPGPRGS